MTHDRRLDEGTKAHYRDAAYYDHAYKRRKEDVLFYAQMAELFGGPVLELGVGTGRVAAAIAERGIELHGVDLMPSMLARAKENLAKAGPDVARRVTLAKGDLRTYRTPRKFPLVISPFNVFMHLYTREDVEQALETVRAHLAKDGRFVFDVLLPWASALARDPSKVYRCGHVKLPDGPRCRYDESFRYDAVSQVQMVSMIFTPLGKPSETTIQRLAHRQFFPAELEALLHYNGFAIEGRHGDFLGGPLTTESESQVIVAKLR